MSKTASGIVLLVGLLLAISAGGMWNVSSGGDLNPAHDWYYDAMTYGAMATFLLGIVMFFLGAMWFSRK